MTNISDLWLSRPWFRGLLLVLMVLKTTMAAAATLQVAQQQKVILVTIDGLRWQEVFYGADPAILRQPAFIRSKSTAAAYANTTAAQLMPFFHQTIKQQGLLVGDRHRGSQMNVSNAWQISYPGYNELLCGFADPALHHNGKIANPNVTVLEWLNQQPELHGQVAAVGSWELLPYILNVGRSKLPVNAGFAPMSTANAGRWTERLQWLNQLQRQTPSPWQAVRLDVFTQQYALTYLQQHQPRLLYIAYGETDDFAHDGHYEQYLAAIKRTDQFIAELWQQLQQDPFYRDQTTLLITTDHGRGEAAGQWQHHGSGRSLPGLASKLQPKQQQISGSEQIWLAALGPQIPARGLVTTSSPWLQSQVASTVAALFGHDFTQFQYKAAVSLAFAPEQQLSTTRRRTHQTITHTAP